MTQLIPNRFLFDLKFQLQYRDLLPRVSGKLSDWDDRERLPQLGEIDGLRDFADVWACWSEAGLAVACRVRGRSTALRCDPAAYWKSDNLRICTDMRDARSNKRATRYCQHFYFLPTGGGRDHRNPVAGTAKIQRAREDAPAIPGSRLQVASQVTADGYSLEAIIPAECLSGFDPAEHPRIGFFYIVEDRELGQQYLTVGDDLNWYVDPSTWATAELHRPPAVI